MSTSELKKQKRAIMLALAQAYEAHDALKMSHAAGTYLQCAACQKIMELTAESHRLELEDLGELSEEKQVISQTKKDVTEFQRIHDFIEHFTIQQYAHFRKSGMTEKDMQLQLDISPDLFRHWKAKNQIQTMSTKVYRVFGKENQIHYYRALRQSDLEYMLKRDGVYAVKMDELEEVSWSSVYIPMADGGFTTLEELVEQTPVGFLTTLEPVMDNTRVPQICYPKGSYEVLEYTGDNGRLIPLFLKNDDTTVLPSHRGKPIQVQRKGKPQMSIKVGDYLVRSPNRDWNVYTKKEFFELFEVNQSLTFVQEEEKER